MCCCAGRWARFVRFYQVFPFFFAHESPASSCASSGALCGAHICCMDEHGQLLAALTLLRACLSRLPCVVALVATL